MENKNTTNDSAALGIGRSIVSRSKNFLSGLKVAAKSTGSKFKNNLRSINASRKVVVAENDKQRRIEENIKEQVARKTREQQVESKGENKKGINNVRAAIQKPLNGLLALLAAWLVDNGKKVAKIIRVTWKKITAYRKLITRSVNSVGTIISSIGKIIVAAADNIRNFDFSDNSGKLKAATDQLDGGYKALENALTNIGEVWGMEESELDALIKSIDRGENYSRANTPAVGAGSRAGGGGSDKVNALLDTIAFAEGTSGSYGTIYGGAVVPELAAGELTVGEVLKMQKTGKVRGRDAGYKRDGYDSDATGRYQFMSYVLEEEIKKQGISLSEKFTPALQDKMILSRIATMRGVTAEKINNEGLSVDIIDRLAPEFASFPNLKGPDRNGRLGTKTSYYGQGGKSQSELTSNFSGNLSKQSNPQPTSVDVASAPPSGNAGSNLATSAGKLNAARLDTSRFGRNGCVYAVNQAYKGAGLTAPWGNDVNYVPTARSVLIRKGFIQVGVKNAQPGDIVIMADTGSPPWVHIGIVSNSGTVLHNSSTNKAFTNNESFSSLMRRYVKIEVYRAPSVVAKGGKESVSSPAKTKANNTEQLLSSRRTGAGTTKTDVIAITKETIIAT